MGRAGQAPLEDRACKSYAVLATPRRLRQVFVDVRRDRLVDGVLLRSEVEADGLHVAVGKQPATVHVLQILLQSPERPRAVLTEPQDFSPDSTGCFVEAMRLGKQVAVEEAYEMREPVVVAVMGSRRQEQQVVAVLRKPLRKLVPLGALDLVAPGGGALRVGAALVGFIDDDEVPPLLPDPFPDVVLLGVVDGRDHLGLPLPKIQKLMLVVGGVDDLERLVEKAEQLVLPLNGQRGRDEDEAPVYCLSELEFLDEEACHDGFARTRVVREQEAQPRLWQHSHIDRLDLMGKSADAGQADRKLTVIGVGETDPG